MKSDEYAAILARVDAAVVANLCGCGCGQQIPARGPSPDFVNEKHQQSWTERGKPRMGSTRRPADWYTDLNAATARLEAAAWDAAPAPTVRRGGIPFPLPDACTDCDDLHCPCHTPRTADPDETPMARVVRETSSLRKAIDKIMGKAR